MSRWPDAATLLERALIARAAAAGVLVEVADAEWVRWASATFTGARHMLVLTGTAGAQVHGWIMALPEAEFTLRGHLVADLVVESWASDGDGFTATVAVLTVEER
jgi:hypothetical protein